MKIIRKLCLILAIGSLFLFSGCFSSSPNHLRKDLANSGPLLLNRDNPYIAANMFLANEVSLSPMMDGFIKHRGAPDAVQIDDHWLRPLRIYFFYLSDQEAYLFEDAEQGWIIRGPQNIPDNVMSKFDGVEIPPKSTAVQEKNLSLKPAAELKPVQSTSLASNNTPPLQLKTSQRQSSKPAETPKPEAISAGISATEVSETEDPHVLLRKPKDKKKTLDNSSEAVSTSTERTPSATSAKALGEAFPNDIIHQVSYPKETLRMISRWYTDTPRNAGRIARINGIENPDSLKIGQEVRVPGYLLKRIDPMPEKQVEKFLNKAH